MNACRIRVFRTGNSKMFFLNSIDLLAAGEDFDGIKKAYPNITKEDIRACLSYAAILADEEAGVNV